MIYLIIFTLFCINVAQATYFYLKIKNIKLVEAVAAARPAEPVETNRSMFSILYGNK